MSDAERQTQGEPRPNRRANRGSKPGELRGAAGKGRVKGSPNKATANAREAIARLVDGFTPRIEGWLEEIYKNDGPKAALACLTDLIEYHVPKLARTEHTGKDGGAIRIVATPEDLAL